MRRIITPCLAMLLCFGAVAQNKNFWTPLTENNMRRNIFADRQQPSAYKLFNLDEAALRSSISQTSSEKNSRVRESSFILSVPNAEGKLENFRVAETPVLHPDLAARYPGIYSFTGQNVDDPGTTIRFAFSPLGFNGTIFSLEKPSVYIERVDKSSQAYIVVARDEIQQPPFECTTKPRADREARRANGSGQILRNADDGKLRTYRLAMACSGEYAQSWLSGSEADDAARRAVVLAAMNNHMTRVNGIMERDFGIRMNLIANNDQLIYLDPDTDPWTAEFNAATQAAIDAAIGDANYDIGHLLKMGGNNGNAGSVGNVCVAGAKGSAFTSRSDWTSGIYFEEYILTHEMGHQYDASHTFTHDSESPSPSQVEPGSGNSIMSYAGITGADTDIQSLMDDYFHSVSIQQATDWIKSHGCHGTALSGLNVPSANAGPDYTVPKSTPFLLTGSGSDPDGGDVLTFNWEQMDVAPSFPWIPSATASSGPAFKSVGPSSSVSRTFPALINILDGSNTNKWEVLPSVSRTLNFRFTVRDNHPGAGSNESDDMVVNIAGDKGPFQVTSPNAAVTWCKGTQMVTWAVNGTEALAANVRILLSTDGGNTFPTELVASTPNDGSEAVNISCSYSNTARIKIEAIDNIFFDISDQNFTVGDNTPPTFTVPADKIIFKDATCNYDASTAATGDVINENDNCSAGLNATFLDATVAGSCPDEIIINRTWTLIDDCSNATVKIQKIIVKDNSAPTFTVPANITIYKDAACNHDASPSVTGNPTNVKDNCDALPTVTYADSEAPGSCVGEVIITRTWSVTDNCENKTNQVQIITVKDNLPPIISNVSVNPGTLWPPNHQMVLVSVDYLAKDNCSTVKNVLTVTSNEPVNGTGDGDTAPDWQVVNEKQVYLRAERAGPRNGRIYTITISSTDDCGNKSTKNVVVTVSHDRRNVRAINSNSPSNNGATPAETVIVNALPNPTHSNFTINFSSDNFDDKVNMRVVDLYGRTIEQRAFMNGTTIRIGNHYKPGVYFVTLMQGAIRKDLKLLKLSH